MERRTKLQGSQKRIRASPIYFCDNPVLGLGLNRTDISKEKIAAIRKLHQRETKQNLKILVFLALWMVMGFIAMTSEWLIVQLLCDFIIGWVIVGFKNSCLNRWVGFVCGAPALVSLSAYRSVHRLHHKYEHTDRDPDDPETAARKRAVPLVVFYYAYAIIGAYIYVFHIAITGFICANRQKRIDIGVEHAIIIGLFFMLCNANYHLEHHLFPSVPWYNLPKLHLLLQPEYQRAGASIYRSYTEFYLDLFLSSRAGIISNTRLIPKHVREQICR
jgi:fatty acid desaturase